MIAGFVADGLSSHPGTDDLDRRAADPRLGRRDRDLVLDRARLPAADVLAARSRRRGRRSPTSDREQARRLARTNPKLAQEIGIGRPDRAGSADAGLVDVNNASVTALLKLPGVDGELATQIIETREHVHGFSSLEDMGLVMDLDGDFVEGLRERPCSCRATARLTR